MRCHLYISGRVQGVAFRYGARRKAEKLGITGWVKNLDDDRVEVVAEGHKDSLKQFTNWCRGGPVFAKVDDVEVKEEKETGEFKEFSVKY